jgi:hypothetical protein
VLVGEEDDVLVGEEDDVLVGEVVMGKQYAFNYANRLLKMGDIATASGGREADAIHCVLDIGGPPLAGHFSDLVGNAVERDVRVECAICLDLTPIRVGGMGLPNYVLRGCSCYTAASAAVARQAAVFGAEDKGHRFHQECLARLPKKECPLCRAPFDRRDALCLSFTKARFLRQEHSHHWL